MSDSQIEEIKSKLNVLDVVGSYVKLSKTGVNYRGVCPFHSEKGPSFFVSPARQMWHCFGCGAGSSIFDFIMKIEGLEFGDALRILADKAGVELKRENPKLRTERERLYEICDLACTFFEKQMGASKIGKEAKEYLLKRGISEDSIKKWRLGYSPDTWKSLSDFLVGRGFKRDEIVSAGLAVSSEKGNNPYDRFRGRIIFPIFDLNSRVIGFGARVFGEVNAKEVAKYINTPQTMLYDKSSVLYGINCAKLAIRKKNQCVLTEGYTDVIMCHQAGFENTVAVSGTALTPKHLNILKRYSENLLLSFDMDLAGSTATKRGIILAESQGFNIKVVDVYSNAKDPAEIILENPQNWEDSVNNARNIMDFYFDSAFAAFDKNTPQGKKEISKIVLPPIKRLQNKIEQSYWVQKLSQKLDIREDAILHEMANLKEDAPQDNLITKPQSKTLQATRRKLLENKILGLVLRNFENLKLIKDDHLEIFTQETKNTFADIRKNFEENPDAKVLAESSKNDFLNLLALRAEIDLGEEEGEEEVRLCLSQLKDLIVREKRMEISKEIQQAEQEKDQEKVQNLIKEFNLIN